MRRVRLTEGQLHNVIRESVCQILNELDWKTYENAYHKKKNRMQNPDDFDELTREVWPLAQASIDASNKIYPHLESAFRHKNNMKPLTPEEQEEYDAYMREFHHNVNGDYKYEKGGRGYYLDDENE